MFSILLVKPKMAVCILNAFLNYMLDSFIIWMKEWTQRCFCFVKGKKHFIQIYTMNYKFLYLSSFIQVKLHLPLKIPVFYLLQVCWLRNSGFHTIWISEKKHGSQINSNYYLNLFCVGFLGVHFEVGEEDKRLLLMQS